MQRTTTARTKKYNRYSPPETIPAPLTQKNISVRLSMIELKLNTFIKSKTSFADAATIVIYNQYAPANTAMHAPRNAWAI